MSDYPNKININLSPEMELQLEIQAEAAGMTRQDYMAQIIAEQCEIMLSELGEPAEQLGRVLH